MAKLNIDELFPDFIVDTIDKKKVALSSLISYVKTGILFLRYEGCTFCRFDMMLLEEEYHSLTTNGSKLLVVLQSEPENLFHEIGVDKFSFPIICDPQRKLYKALDINPAESEKGLIGEGIEGKMRLVKESGLSHGAYEGDELQLPAAFVIDENRKVLFSHYSKSITDIPSIEKWKQLLK